MNRRFLAVHTRQRDSMRKVGNVEKYMVGSVK